MQSIILLLLRLSTGIYLILWGLIKFKSKEVAVSVSDTYYGGIASPDLVNALLGGLEVAVGALVILGLYRSFSYLAQAAIYLVGLLAITPYILDPYALYWVSSPRLTFFPSTTLFFASMVMIAFKEFDTRSLDAKRGS